MRRWKALMGVAALTLAGVHGIQQPVALAAPATTATIYGKSGTFGSLGGTAGQLPSGQKLTKTAVSSWNSPPGHNPFFTDSGSDGTVFAAGLDHNASYFFPTSPRSEILSFEPGSQTYRNILLKTTTGKTSMARPDGTPMGASVSDVQAINGGDAIAFITPVPTEGPKPAVDGTWPSFGILTKTDGRWEVADQWTGAQLRASHPVNGPRACPPVSGHSYCRGLNEMALFPRSRDIIVTQYIGGSDDAPNAGLVALRVTGPDAQGRFTTTVRGSYLFPKIKNPETPDPDDYMSFSPRAVNTDPTGTLGDERFLVNFDAWNVHSAAIEFSYDAASGNLKPVSAPFVPGDRTSDGRFYGATGIYDDKGTLWARRGAGFPNGKLAVYPKVNGERKITSPACPFDPGKTLDAYTTTADGKTVWGQTCAPDYDIVQPREPIATMNMFQNPVTRDIVLLGQGGTVTAIRASGSGRNMTFRIGTLVDAGTGVLPRHERGIVNTPGGTFDSSGKFWFWAGQIVPPSCNIPIPPPDPLPDCATDNRNVQANQWLVSVDVAQLFAPPPVLAPNVAGWWAEVQAEYTATTTTRQRPGTAGAIEVDSDAYVKRCGGGCADDGVPGSGYYLADDTGFGHMGGVVEYRLNVPTAGNYELRYRASTLEPTTNARIRFEVGGTAYTTPVNTGGPWRTVTHSVPVSLPAGTQTVRLSAPSGGGGWYLNWFALIRK